MQEDLEQRTVSVSIQAAKLSGRVLRSAIAAVLRKMEQERTTPKVGRNSMKRLTYKDPGANTIEVSGRIRSFERFCMAALKVIMGMASTVEVSFFLL